MTTTTAEFPSSVSARMDFRDAWGSPTYFDPNFRRDMDKRLAEIAALPKNWDHEGAPRINPKSVRNVRSVIQRLEGIAPRPQLVPIPNGEIQLEWIVGKRELELEILSSGMVHYLKWFPDGDVQEEGEYSVSDLARTVSLIQWLCQGDE